MSSSDIDGCIATITKLQPVTIYPIAVSINVGLYLALINTSIIGYSIAGVFALIGVGSFIINKVFRREHFMNLVLKQIHDEHKRKIATEIDNLYDSMKGYDNRNTDLQMTRLLQKVETFNEILKNRFAGEGLAYSRFLGVSDTILSNAMKSYFEITFMFKQYYTIDLEYIEKTIATIEVGTISDELSEKIQTLKTRIQIKSDLSDQIDNLLLQNELAMTRMDLTLTDFADRNTERELEWAMQELTGLSSALSPTNQSL